MTVRIDQSLSSDDLWRMTNQILAERGFASVEFAGIENHNLVSIVRLTEAAGAARVESDLPPQSQGGFVSVLLTVQHRPLKEVSEAVKVFLSKPGGAIQELPAQSQLLVSDLRPRIDQIVDVLAVLDAADEATVTEIIDAKNLPAVNLAALVTATMTSRNSMIARSVQGKLTATPDNNAMLLIAPKSESSKWHEVVALFDRPSQLETRTYSTLSFTLEEVAKLVTDVARDTGPRGSGDCWRIVMDTLAGLLVVTASPAEHEQIALLVDRLNALPAEVRRPVRAFPIRNRSVSAIVEVLTNMLEAGVLDAEIAAPIGAGVTSGPSIVNPNDLQRTDRTSESTTTAPNSISAARPSGSGGTGANRSNQLSLNADSRPSLTLTADEGTNTLIAVGEPRKLAQLEELLRTLDVRQPQVMIEVLVVSLSDGDTLDLGVELEKIEVNGDTVTTLASLFGLGGIGGAGGAVSGKGFTGLILNPGDFRILIRALQTLNNGRSLNMPKVLVSNNQQANLDSVVQQPFVSTNASDTVATTSFGGFENAGTTITVKPQIAKGDHLVLEYSVSLSAFVGESSDPGIPPPRQQNNLQSVVTVPDGYTVVVGGIEVETKADAVSQIPLLGSIPFLGEAFKSRSKSTSRSRFYVFIRPSILRQEGFEDLKYLSDVATRDTDVDDGFPEVEPRIIR